jgi:hypothetical protein
LYKLQPDGTHTLFQVKYDLNYDSFDDESGDDISLKEEKEISKGHLMA